MDARYALPFLLVPLLALPVAAAPATGVATADDDVDSRLASAQARLAFMDSDGDAKPDAALPDEPAYLDLDASDSVTFGDLRLTAFGPYPAGTLVDVANRDVGRALVQSAGWIGTAAGTWFADLDGDNRVSIGDVRLAADGDARARYGDAELGQRLALPAVAATQRHQLGYVDADRDGKRAVEAPLYLDADGNGAVSAGDLRLQPAGFGLDVGPSPAEVEAALQVLAAAEAQRAADAAKEGRGGWGAWQVVTLLAAFAALALVAIAVVRSRRAAGPRDPFTTAPLPPGRFK